MKSVQGDQINWNQVFYFSRIAAAGSLKSAGEELGLSPSTLSEHLAQLEFGLNKKLFQRHHRRLSLTDDGARLYQSARQMFEAGKQFSDLIAPAPIGSHPIAIGLVPGSTYGFAHGIIGDYLQCHNDVSAHLMRFQHDELEAALLASQLDFGFTDRRSERKDIVQVEVVGSELRFFVSSKIQDRGLADLLKDMPLAVCRAERHMPSTVEAVLDSMQFTARRMLTSEYPSIVEGLCRAGKAVAALGRKHFENDRAVRMLRLPRDFPKLVERLYATWLQQADDAESVRRLKPLLAARG